MYIFGAKSRPYVFKAFIEQMSTIARRARARAQRYIKFLSNNNERGSRATPAVPKSIQYGDTTETTPEKRGVVAKLKRLGNPWVYRGENSDSSYPLFFSSSTAAPQVAAQPSLRPSSPRRSIVLAVTTTIAPRAGHNLLSSPPNEKRIAFSLRQSEPRPL